MALQLRAEEYEHAYGVEREPGYGKGDGDRHQHPHDPDFGALDVALGLAAANAGDVPLPDLNAYH